MKRFVFLIVPFLLSSSAFSQSLHVGVFGGLSNYQGDLIDNIFVKNSTKAAGGINLQYEVTERFSLRGGFTFAKVTGNDDFNSKTYLQTRNLHFESSISEFSLLGEFSPFSLYNMRWTPYVFGGIAVFRFNPYTKDSLNAKVFLKPLSTEGQGLEGYEDRKPYSQTQFAIPFGGGFKYAISDNIRIGAELGIRKLFTDYLDDVSTNYADPTDLLAQRGQLAVDYSYRGDEVEVGDPAYPAKGAQRGGAKQKDLYYFTGLTLSFRLGSSYGGTFAGKGKKGNYGCPKVPY
jgi:opacity protein-like surface antigen